MPLQSNQFSDGMSLLEKRQELRRVLQSKYFANAPKKSRFLEFVAEQTLLGNGDKLNEYLVGVEVYGRGADFNPQDDPIVRVQAHDIRRALKAYYDEFGGISPLRIELPPGHYVPVFVRASPEEEASAAVQVAPPASPHVRLLYALVLGLAAACLSLTLLVIHERRVAEQASSALQIHHQLPDGLEWFWKPFLPPAPAPIIVIPNHPLLRAAHNGDSPQTIAHGLEIPKDRLPEFRDTIQFRELKRFIFVPSLTDFTAVGETMGLLDFFNMFSSVGQKFTLEQSRLLNYDEINSSNVILLGGNQAWSGRVFLYPEGFHFEGGVIFNKHPLPGEKPVYKPEFDPITNHLILDYALVLMLPNVLKENRILLVYGIYTQGSQGAIDYITSPDRMAVLRKAVMALSPDHKNPPPYFQVLFKTTVENSVPGETSVVAVRRVFN